MLPEVLQLPDGWKSAVTGRFVRFSSFDDDRFELVPAGTVLLPRRFTLAVGPLDLRGLILLNFGVDDDGVVTLLSTGVWPSGVADLGQALDTLRAARPMDFWRRHAIARAVISELLAAIDEDHEDEGDPDLDFDLGSDEMPEQPGQRIDIWKMLGARALEDAASKADQVATLRPRNRITDGHLREVAKVYRGADAEGVAPTRAVAGHFKTSHSTAARWVGLARDRGHLGPARGTRGGEADRPVAEDRAERERQRDAELEAERLEREEHQRDSVARMNAWAEIRRLKATPEGRARLAALARSTESEFDADLRAVIETADEPMTSGDTPSGHTVATPSDREERQ